MEIFMGKPICTKREITNKIWEHCKANSLLKTSFLLLDETMLKLFGEFAKEIAEKEKKLLEEIKEKKKREGEFKINLFQLKNVNEQKKEEKKEPVTSQSNKLALFHLNNAIFQHIISIASFEFHFTIPKEEVKTVNLEMKENELENMDESWSVFDVMVRLQSENINEAMPFFVQKVFFEEKEREKILSKDHQDDFNEVMVLNEQIKLDHQKIGSIQRKLEKSFYLQKQLEMVNR